MSRKDYVAAAEIVAEHFKVAQAAKSGTNRRSMALVTAETVMDAFVAFFRQYGGRFDEARFREACHSEKKR